MRLILFLLFCVAVLFFLDFLLLFLFDQLHLFLFLTLEDVQGVKYPLVVGLRWGQVWSINHFSAVMKKIPIKTNGPKDGAFMFWARPGLVTN